MDNCSAHRGQRAVDRLRSQWPNVVLVHTPVHASWLNQIEIYFSIVQRKVLTPNDFKSLSELEQTFTPGLTVVWQQVQILVATLWFLAQLRHWPLYSPSNT
jgi:hypothetical protein